MNQHAAITPGEPHQPGPRRFTVDEFMRMGETGILAEDERVELIGGEIIVMSPAGRLHEVLRSELGVEWGRAAPRTMKVVTELQLRLSDHHQPVADVGVFPASLLAPDTRGSDMLLVVEIADSSLDKDLGVKAAAYASGGVREYWVINAKTRSTLIHREPEPTGYASITEVAADQPVTPLLAPELTIRLSDLPAA